MLRDVMAFSKLLPGHIGIMLELAHPSMMVARDQAPRHQLDLNQIVDAVLRTILQTSASLGGVYARRKIIFTSFCPDICAALNWKQPNCESFFPFVGQFILLSVYHLSDPVFFASRCGRANDSSTPSALTMKDKNDHRLNSLSSAVELAQVNNLLGIYVDSALLVRFQSYLVRQMLILCHSSRSHH